MPSSVIVVLVSVLLTLLVGVVSFAAFRRAWVWRRPGANEIPPAPTYAQLMAQLTKRLERASSELGSVLQEMQSLAKERQSTLEDLIFEVYTLESEIDEKLERVAALESVPLPAVEHLAKLMEPGERRARNRDWVIFILGLLAGLVIQVVGTLLATAR